ncbi:dihydroneopterin aldolase [Heyndrickxia sporothermodurans]|uniref:7,8-dihydroneopterin aldolase n=1 Tax=Heyndrickxia sporothermodurans TaxID=46224 RepID=A0AB37HK26_9BACI|nr:dihydroneopterin aldolase [Heyndrickxia sporothermodurans]MBL5767100.1 dihydroneopterin aldolase [Heyndrickxia sporothermodurans]MBL5770599.1 dihydroneopterin aldolase [Heyndrickxia sporothermodurans]MBL5774285.1 dihydroneopterin aldolase [Heyndrickxia sporothermodurans]MBL5777830.1 dihydroneopterin aldolase [Heyndrickxia sporothermodurans]MBL5781405.1 dihydroneopterin aldolase [Heyndrickxia sporothermodurans]
MDKIIINNMEFYGYHGVLPEENRLGQRFRVTLTLELDLQKAGKTDNLHDTVSYAEVYEVCKEIVEGRPHQLLESVAENLSEAILESFPLIEQITVQLIKPDPPIRGHYQSVAVEISRRKSR